MAQTPFKIMTDEHVANAIAKQLVEKGVDAVRLIDMLNRGTPDPEVLQYCHEHRYSLITLDERMRGHITQRTISGKEHAGVFIGGNQLQGSQGIGAIVKFIVFYDESIKSGATTVVNDVYNQIIQMS